MAVSKSELLEALRTSESEVLDQLKNLPAEEFEKGRYENGWNARQILAHMASIEWTYPRLIDLAKQPPSAESPGEAPTKKAKGGIGSYNDRQVEKRAGATVEELLAEFETNRQATIKAVEEQNDETLSKEVTSAGGFNGPLAQVLHWVAVDHIRIHLNDIVNGTPG
jgi:uncharacterized damage-inducible protein DinB